MRPEASRAWARPVPILPGGARLLGHLRAMAAAPHRFPADALAAHGGLVGWRVGPRHVIGVGRPDLARHVLVTEAARYPRGAVNRNLGSVIGDGLLATEGELWLGRRRALQPAFRPERLHALARATHAVMDEVLARWTQAATKGEVLDALAEARRIAIRVIGRALLSRDIDETRGAAFTAAVQDSLIQLVRRNWLLLRLPLWVPVPLNRALLRTRRRLDAFIGAEVDARLAPGAGRPDDMLSAIIAGREGLPPLSREALVNETKTLFVAGFETTATALTWLFHLLSRHPEVAGALGEEARALAGPPGLSDMARLPLTAAVVQEGMRLYPPVYNMGRECAGGDVLDGHAIPHGATVLVSIFAIHRDPGLWEAPEAFRPGRFLGEGAAARRAWLPYAWGRHQCIGNHFADLGLALVLARITPALRLLPVDEAPVGLAARTTLVPDRRILLRPVR